METKLPESMDAAWETVEAVLPKGWGVEIHPQANGQYLVGASEGNEWMVVGSGPTPTSALLDLAEALRISAP